VGAGQPPARHPAESALAESVSPDRLRQTVRELVALGPRMGGTPSGDRAAASVDRAFRDLGLESRIERDPTQLAHWEDAWSVELTPSGGRLESAWPYGYSPSVDPAADGALVAVRDLAAATPEGSSSSASASSSSWAGRVIYTPGPVTRAYAAIATSPHRPLAILTSAPDDPRKNFDWARLGALRADASNPIPVFALSYLDGRTAEAAAARGWSVRVHLRSHVRQGQAATVVATLRGRDPDKYFLVSAHGDSDSGGPGADDNASGVATVVEIARALAALARDGGWQPRYSIRFVIWGSEYHSAKAYIDREGSRLADCLAVLNFDETGTGAERETIYFEPDDVPWNADLMRTLKSVGADYAGRPGFWPEFATNPSQGGTDSYAFLPQQYKGMSYTPLQIPATTIYTAAWDQPAKIGDLVVDYSAYYHSSGDVPENTTEREPQNMVRAVKAAGITLLRLLQ
jgi:hypothetical protein